MGSIPQDAKLTAVMNESRSVGNIEECPLVGVLDQLPRNRSVNFRRQTGIWNGNTTVALH